MAGFDSFQYAGIQNAEMQDRVNEHRSGVPNLGAGAILLSAPANRTSKIGAMNLGDNPIHVRARHQGATKTITNEHLVALHVGSNRYVGKVAAKAIVKGSVTITNAGAPVTIVDDSNGVLYDTGFVGVAANKRGTIDYVNGIVDFTFGSGPTQPVRMTYQHTDFTDFAGPTQTQTVSSFAIPGTMKTSFGRVVPFSVAFNDGVITFVDDGKGNIIETTTTAVKRGTIDYGTGLISLATTSLAFAGNITLTYTFNPFATLLSGGGGQKTVELFPGAIPELSAQAWANGIKADAVVGLWGEGTMAGLGSSMVGKFSHFGDEPYRVTEDFSGFPAGGQSNDPRA